MLPHQRSHCEDHRRPARRSRRLRSAASRQTTCFPSARTCSRLPNQRPQPQLQAASNRSLLQLWSASVASTRKNLMSLTRQASDAAGRWVLILINEKVLALIKRFYLYYLLEKTTHFVKIWNIENKGRRTICVGVFGESWFVGGVRFRLPTTAL